MTLSKKVFDEVSEHNTSNSAHLQNVKASKILYSLFIVRIIRWKFP